MVKTVEEVLLFCEFAFLLGKKEVVIQKGS